MNDNIFLHCLNLFPKFGPKRLLLLGAYFKNFEHAFQAPATEIAASGIGHEIAAQFASFRTSVNPNTEQARLEQAGIGLLSEQESGYPELLKEISSRPALLYYRGSLPAADAVMLAAVGTRKITTYGRSVIPTLLGPLIDAGLVLVSGLAFGVDSAVHKEVIARSKPTVAVLGSGVDDKALYPKEHALLAKEIIDSGGCILSEYPPGTPGFKQNFVARNRIISGLSIGTLIIECDLKSGSLITAEFALEQNRRLYAVPGPIYALESRGPNNLIKMGAQLVTEASDILQDLHIETQTFAQDGQTAPDSPVEGIVLSALGNNPTAADEIIKQSGLAAAAVTTALTFLEMKGRIKNVGGQQYIKVR